MSILDSIQKQYESNKQGRTFSNSVDFSKYFAVRLEDGDNSGEAQLRLMPTNGESPFEEGYWHSVKVGDRWRKLYCKQHNDGGDCPLCNVAKELRSTGSEEDKKLARQFEARKFYIVRVIDRANESDGVKFWRFPHNWKGEGIFDKMVPLFTKKGDITNPREGRDVVLIIGRDDKKYAKVTSIMSEDVSLLTDDAKKAKAWMAETETWKDIYKCQTDEYLEIVANGEIPVWDKNREKFVSESDKSEAEVVFTSSQPTSQNEDTTSYNDDDQLPF